MRQEKNYVYYLLILASIAWLFSSIDLAVWIAFGELQAKSARDRLFYGLLRKEIAWYDMRKDGIGAMLPRLQARIRDIQLATSQPLGILVSALSTAILSLVQALVLSWKLTLVTISTVPVVMVAIVWVGRGTQTAFDKQGQRLTAAQKHATSALSAIETVKCFNAQHIEQRKYMTCVMEAAVWYCRAASSNGLQIALMVLLSSAMFVQGFYYGGVLISKGESNTADVITTFVSAISAFQAMNAFLPQLMVLERGRIAGSVLRAVMAQVQQQPDVPRTCGNLTPRTCHGAIEIKNLTFSYPSNSELPAIQNLSMFIPPRETTFIIGRSGSGKSTLGQLLLRFYSGSHGSISLDGINLEDLEVDWLRSNISLVEQTSLLFNDTIFRNIAFGKRTHDEVSKREVVEAAEFALLHLTIHDMPNGFETVVGYGGSALSGGQRQRMALARARLRDTPILVLDECTSALDHISRSLVMDAIRQWRSGKTTIIITHDISQILPNDYMYIIERGRLVQEGYRKHMERLKDMPFQTFLLEELTATTLPYDNPKGTTLECIDTRSSLLDSESRRQSRISVDSLDAQLNTKRNQRNTFLPGLVQDSKFLPTMGTRGYAGSSPWMRPVTSSPSESLSGPVWSGRWTKKDNGPSNIPREDLWSGRRMSQSLEDLVAKTGAHAASARESKDTYRRAKVIEPERKSRPTTQQNRRPKHTDLDDEEKDDIFTSRSLRQILSTIWPKINNYPKTMLILGFWGSTIHAVTSPVFSYVLSKLLHLYSIPGGDSRKSLTYSMIILALSCIDAIHTYSSHFCLEYVGQRWIDSIRGEAMNRILDQPRAFFDKEENSVSRLTGCLDRNAEEMRNLLGRFLSLMWIAALMSTVSIIWAMVAQWKMTLLALAVAPYIFGVTKAYAVISERWEKLSNDTAEVTASMFAEIFTNIKTVRALTLEDHFTNKYIRATDHALAVGFRRALFTGFFYGVSDSAGNFSIAMIFYVSSRLVTAGDSVEDIVQVLVMLIFTITNVEAILGFIPQIGSSKDTASRLLRLAELPKDSHEHLGDVRISTVGDLTFNDLQFSYPSRPEQSVLKHLSVHMPSGRCTAIVGGSGSGKSTIANLLLKLYGTAGKSSIVSHTGNNLILAGRNINRIETDSLRSVVVPVMQTPAVFGASISENIAYGLSPGSPHNNHTSISAAASQAGIHDFINSLPQGYNTLVGDGGMGLSGGQAQRIAIARALVRRPSVLILDEATSALDVESANLVRQTIENLIKDRDRTRAMTVIVITHSREMMEIADNVVVLDQGRVVEEGGLEELLERNGPLANLLSGGEWNDEITESGKKSFGEGVGSPH